MQQGTSSAQVAHTVPLTFIYLHVSGLLRFAKVAMTSTQISGPMAQQEPGPSMQPVRAQKRAARTGKKGFKSPKWKRRIKKLLKHKGDIQNGPWDPYMVLKPGNVTKFHSDHRIEVQQVRTREGFAKWAISEVTRDMGHFRVIGHVTPEEVDLAIQRDAQHDIDTEV